MAVFVYKAKDAGGKGTRGKIIASDTQDALLKLRINYPIILFLEEDKKKMVFQKSKKVSLDSLAQFARELSTMVGSGTSLTKSLTILGKQFKEKTLSTIAHDLSAHIESGNSFTEGLKKYQSVFSPLYINMVAAGEASGMLKNILERLAVYLEKTASLRRKVKTAMVYPVAIIIVSVVITSVLILKVIPGFKDIFEGLGGKLPLPTQIVIGVSDISRKYFLLVAGGFFFLGMGILKLIRTPWGSRKLDYLKLSFPVFGPLFQKVAIARFARTLGTLLKSGVSILEALNIVSKVIGNKVLGESILRARDDVRKGKRLASNLEGEKFFPAMVIEMIGIGEETGELESLLEKISDAYDEQIDLATDALVSMIEPFIIIFLGIVVGGIVIAMFLPILKITQLVGG